MEDSEGDVGSVTFECLDARFREVVPNFDEPAREIDQKMIRKRLGR